MRHDVSTCCTLFTHAPSIGAIAIAAGSRFPCTLGSLSQVPPDITCERCVLQWTYITANSRDQYPETFWNCADISIKPAGYTGAIGCDVSGLAPPPSYTPRPPPATSYPYYPALPPYRGGDTSGGGDTPGGGTDVSRPDGEGGRVACDWTKPFFCATYDSELVANTASCMPCRYNADCPDGRACWASAYCTRSALCGSNTCDSGCTVPPPPLPPVVPPGSTCGTPTMTEPVTWQLLCSSMPSAFTPMRQLVFKSIVTTQGHISCPHLIGQDQPVI